MKTLLFIGIVLASGFFAGLIHSGINLVLVEPLLDQAIGIENEHLFASGEEKNTPEFWVHFDSYRYWQKGGQILAGAILGTSVGALFGIVFAYSRNVLPGRNYVKKALILAGIMWFTIYFIPFLKYPANPPTVGDPDTIVLRSILYVLIIMISGFGVVGFYQISKRISKHKKIVGLAGYAVFIIIVFLLTPSNPDKITAPMSLVNEFRMMSMLAVSGFWISLGLILGIFWHKLKPDVKLESTQA